MSNAGQAALGIVGGIIGFAIGGPAGAAYGLQIGLAVGSVVAPTQLPGTFGPRLNDKRTTTAQLGEPITEVFGTDVVAGTVIWLGDVVEHSETEEVGGKGGPEGENTTFSYTQSIAVGLCRGPAVGLLRIWENGKLVYDVRVQQPGESISDYSMRLDAATNYAETFTLYLGGESQLPDPTIELKEGVGNVPAFRGLMYIVYPDRDLKDDQGQRHPAFKFEIANEVVLPLPLLLMVADAANLGEGTEDPRALICTVQELANPLVSILPDTFDDATIVPRDICGNGEKIFAIGWTSQTQFFARISFDVGLTWSTVIVAPFLAVEPELPSQIQPTWCDISPGGRIVVTGFRVPPGDTTFVQYHDGNGSGPWSTVNPLAYESDFRPGVIRYVPDLDIWLLGGHRGICKSLDGAAYTQVVSGVASYNPINFVFGAGIIAALRLGSIDVSADEGETWTEAYAGGFSHRALAYGNGKWVRYDAGGSAGFSVADSLEGPWSALGGADPSWDIRDMTYDGVEFVAVGSITPGVSFAFDSLIVVSTDGLSWTVRTSGDVPNSIIRRIHQALP
jgi:hypothetical protein